MEKNNPDTNSSITLDCLERSLQAQNDVLDVAMGK